MGALSVDARAHFATVARYNAWATQRLLDAVAAVNDTDYRRDTGLFFKSIHGTLNHLLVGEHLLWFRRWKTRNRTYRRSRMIAVPRESTRTLCSLSSVPL